MSWHRVTKARPCEICGKLDWCTFAENGAACCMRTESRVPMANGGWLHSGDSKPLPAPVARRKSSAYAPPAFNAQLWHEATRHACRAEKLYPWADSLGLPAWALDFMGASTLGDMLAFPMHDGAGQICGIRTRMPDGSKKAVSGSRAGVFLATFHMPYEPLICEGPTDSAAALALDFEPIGRPSCMGCERHVVDTCARFGYQRITICADSDGPGLAGARRLAEVLNAAKISVRMVAPGGHKDLRDWFKTGVSRQQVYTQWAQAEWR